VFDTYDGKRSISKDDDGNVLLYRYDNSAMENVATPLEGVTVTKDETNSVNGYEVYQIKLEDTYDFETGFYLRLLRTYADGDGVEQTDEIDRYIHIEMSDEGLNIAYPGWDDDSNPVYDEEAVPLNYRYFIAGYTSETYFVTKSEDGTITRYTSVPTVKTLDGTVVDSSAVTIESNTNSSGTDGLYNITFHQEGAYHLVASDGSYVIAYVSMPDAAFYSSAEITGANLIENTYIYQPGKTNTFYFAFDTYHETQWISTDDKGNVLLYRWNRTANDGEGANVATSLDGVNVTEYTESSVEGYKIYEITLDDSYDFETGFYLRLLYSFVDENGDTQSDEYDRYIGIELSDEGLNIAYPGWDDDDNPVYDKKEEPSKSRYFTAGYTERVYFVTKSEDGTITRYTTAPTVRNLDGTAVTDSVATIVQSTHSGDTEGLYEVTFYEEGTYRIVSTDGSYVMAYVSRPDVAFYSSAAITGANLIEDTYTYQPGKTNTFYFAFDTHDETRSI
jgi:hypothetical protein